MTSEHTLALADADAALVGTIVDAVHALARLHLAAEQSAHAPGGIDPTEVELSRPVRFVLDENTDLIGLGLVQRDGTIRRLNGWHLSKLQAHLRAVVSGDEAATAH